MRIRAATQKDLAAVLQLLTDTGLPIDGVDAHIVDFIVAEEGNAISGVIGIERYGGVGLLRSAAVSAGARGQGLGTQLVETVLERAESRGVEDVYLLTTTAAEYFPRFGFSQVARSAAPPQLRASREFQGACPETAILMKHGLAGEDEA